MPEMTIGALAKASAVGVETVRYYQRRGLLAEPQRPPGGVRRYSADSMARLAFIGRAEDVGFTLDEVATLLKLGQTPNCSGARALAARKLELVEARLRSLQRVRRVLGKLIAQCDAGGKRRCPIIASLAGGG